MIDVIFLMMAIAFVMVATLAAVATTSASPTVRGIANKTINGSSAAAALVSVVLTLDSSFGRRHRIACTIGRLTLSKPMACCHSAHQ